VILPLKHHRHTPLPLSGQHRVGRLDKPSTSEGSDSTLAMAGLSISDRLIGHVAGRRLRPSRRARRRRSGPANCHRSKTRTKRPRTGEAIVANRADVITRIGHPSTFSPIGGGEGRSATGRRRSSNSLIRKSFGRHSCKTATTRSGR
jgi:hypothetical protein